MKLSYYLCLVNEKINSSIPIFEPIILKKQSCFPNLRKIDVTNKLFSMFFGANTYKYLVFLTKVLRLL